LSQPDLSSAIPRPSRHFHWTQAITDGLSVGLKTSLWLISIMVPTGFVVLLLRLIGVLTPLAVLFDPIMGLAGLPGEAAFILATSALITIYPAIGVMATVGLTGPQVAVMALMVLICHNLFVETAIQSRVGSHPVSIVLLRVLGAFVVGILVARFLGLDRVSAGTRELSIVLGFPAWEITRLELLSWLWATAATVVRVMLVVIILMVAQRLLEYWGVLRPVARVFGPFVAFFGLPRSTAFLWIVANTLGLTYGSAVIIEERRAGHVSKRDADLLNHHLAVCHSLLEDTLLFVALGVGPGILILPRLMIAFLVVWARRFFLKLAGEKRRAAV
jgi:hypothetical protein